MVKIYPLDLHGAGVVRAVQLKDYLAAITETRAAIVAGNHLRMHQLRNTLYTRLADVLESNIELASKRAVELQILIETLQSES